MLNDLLDYVIKELSFEPLSSCTVDLFFSLVRTFCVDSGLQMDEQFILVITRSIIEIPLFEVLNEAGDRITIEDLIAYGSSYIKFVRPTHHIRMSYICGGSVDPSLSETQLRMLERIVESKDAGITQIELAQVLSLEPKVVFHLLKRLLELELVSKYPFVYRKSSTNILFHNKFDCYLAEDCARALEINNNLTISSVTFQAISDVLIARPQHSIFIADLARILQIHPKDYKRLRGKLTYYSAKGMIERFVSSYEGKRMFCVRLCQEKESAPDCESVASVPIMNLCSTFERDLIQLGKAKPSGIYCDDICGSLMLKRKAITLVYKLFGSTDENAPVPFLLTTEVVGKEHRNKLILKPSYYQDNVSIEPSIVQSNNKAKRIGILKSYIEKELVFKKDFEFYNEIRKLNGSPLAAVGEEQQGATESKHIMCTKTIKNDLLTLVNEGFCTIIPYDAANYNGTKASKDIVVHCSKDLKDPRVLEAIEHLKKQTKPFRSAPKFQFQYCEPTFNDQPPSSNLEVHAPKKAANFWIFQSKKYGYLTPEMQRAKELHLYLWNRLSNTTATFSIIHDISCGFFPLSLFLKLCSITEEIEELATLIEQDNFNSMQLQNLSLDSRKKICNQRSKNNIKQLIKIMLLLHIIEAVGEDEFKFCPIAFLIDPYQTTNGIIQHELSNLRDIFHYWTRFEQICIDERPASNEASPVDVDNPDEDISSSSVDDMSLLATQNDQLEMKKFSERIKQVRHWRDIFIVDAQIIAHLNTFVDYERGYTPYYNEEELQAISANTNISIPRLKHHFYEHEKTFKRLQKECSKRQLEEEKVLDADFCTDDGQPPEFTCKYPSWTKKKDEILLIASVIVRDIVRTTPMKFLWSDIRRLFKDEVDPPFLRHRFSLLSKYLALQTKAIVVNWSELKQELMAENFFNPMKRSFSCGDLIQILVAYQQRYKNAKYSGLCATGRTTNTVVAANFSLEEFMHDYHDGKCTILPSSHAAKRKKISEAVDEAISFKYVKFIMQTRKFLLPVDGLVTAHSKQESECTKFARKLIFCNKKSEHLYSLISNFTQSEIAGAVEWLVALKTLDNTNRGCDYSSLITYRPSEKVKTSFSAFEEACTEYKQAEIPSIFGVKSTEFKDEFLVDLLYSVAMHEKSLKIFGTNLLVSNAADHKFSKISPFLIAQASLTSTELDILNRGEGWKTDENDFNMVLLSVLKWEIGKILVRNPGCRMQTAFAYVNHLVSWDDFQVFLSFLSSCGSVAVQDENIFLAL